MTAGAAAVLVLCVSLCALLCLGGNVTMSRRKRSGEHYWRQQAVAAYQRARKREASLLQQIDGIEAACEQEIRGLLNKMDDLQKKFDAMEYALNLSHQANAPLHETCTEQRQKILALEAKIKRLEHQLAAGSK